MTAVAEPGATTDTAGVRALRSAAALTLFDVALASRIDWLKLREQLDTLKPRGGCAAAVATAAISSTAQHSLDALNHRACPPYAARAATGYGPLSFRSRVRTAAGWSTRSTGPDATRAVLARLAATQQESHTLTEASRHSCTPAAILEHLACGSDADVVHNVARNPNASIATLAQLAARGADTVRRWVACNPSTSAATLTLLAKNPDPTVRRWVVCNPSTSAATLTLLAKDPDPAVRSGVAQHPSTPQGVSN